MPLTAIHTLTGEPIDSISCSPDAWAALRRLPVGTLVMKGNRQPAVLKRSIRGLQFFAHPPGGRDPNYQPESPMHLEIKAELVRGLRAAGYRAAPEQGGTSPSGEAWEADVLAEGEGRKVAFEVQLSPQTLEEYERRSLRYHASGVEVVWLIQGHHYHAFSDSLYYRDPARACRYPGHADFPAFPVRAHNAKHHSGTVAGAEVVVWPRDRAVANLCVAAFATGFLRATPLFLVGTGWVWQAAAT